MQSPIQSYLEELHRSVTELTDGELASYIPELTKADPAWFGICLVTMDGKAYCVGDCEQSFTIQSISKPFVYATALTDRGVDLMRRKVGVEPSGDAFNSISLDPQSGAPLNPMINAGAIATTSLVAGATAAEQWERIAAAFEVFLGRKILTDDAVNHSESATGHRNRAIAWMLKNSGVIDGDPMAAVENYFRQCSILVDCRDLALLAATLANGGINPLTRQHALPESHGEQVLSVMATCGMYDYAGGWLFEVGMPAKSGVSGGIIAVLPGRFGIGIFSPKLDARGNSVRGIEVCKRLARDFGLHVFARGSDSRTALGRTYTAAEAPSRRKPSPRLQVILGEQAHRIKYLSLHGYLAVDGIEYVIRRMQELAPCSHSFILDMHKVDGVSKSAARLLAAARNALADEQIAVVYSRIHGRQSIMNPLSHALRNSDNGFISFEDNDLAVEWCENRLCGSGDEAALYAHSLADFPLLNGLPAEILRKLEVILKMKTFAAGELILTSGQSAENGEIFLLYEGVASLLVPLGNGSHQRIATLGAGMSFGEMVLLGQTTRSATVCADTLVRCGTLAAIDLDRISRDNPQLRITLLENVARDMASNLRRATQWIAALA